MKHVFSTSCAVFLSLLMLVTSCKKGDAGPEGPAGPAGPGGAPGNAGPKGDPGTANVIYSTWQDVTFLPDTIMDGNVVVDTVGYYHNMEVDGLTNTILNTGEIKVYINVNNAANPVIFPLPYIGNPIYIDVTYALNVIALYSNAPVGTQGTGANKVQQYRYVLIPGGTPARSAINWNDYASVKKYLNLPD